MEEETKEGQKKINKCEFKLVAHNTKNERHTNNWIPSARKEKKPYS